MCVSNAVYSIKMHSFIDFTEKKMFRSKSWISPNSQRGVV